MTFLPLRTVALPDASRSVYAAWLAEVEASLAAPDPDWNRLARDILAQLYHPGVRDYAERVEDPSVPLAAPSTTASANTRLPVMEAMTCSPPSVKAS